MLHRAASAVRIRSESIQRKAFEGLLKLTYRNGNSKGFMEACHDSAEAQHVGQGAIAQSIQLAGLEQPALMQP